MEGRAQREATRNRRGREALCVGKFRLSAPPLPNFLAYDAADYTNTSTFVSSSSRNISILVCGPRLICVVSVRQQTSVRDCKSVLFDIYMCYLEHVVFDQILTNKDVDIILKKY